MQELFPMCALRPGEEGIVESITLTGDLRRRMQDIGLIPGTHITCVGRSPLGDPCAFRIRGTVIALRNCDSSAIILRREL